MTFACLQSDPYLSTYKGKHGDYEDISVQDLKS